MFTRKKERSPSFAHDDCLKVGWLLNASPVPTFVYANPPYAWVDDNAELRRPTN